MSRYAWFACIDCKVSVWLGKEIRGADGRIDRFHIGGPDDPPNSSRPELVRAIAKMMAEHAGHGLQVVTAEDAERYGGMDAFVEIGGDERKDLGFAEYLAGWRG